MHAPGGIRNRNPSKRAAVYLSFRPRGRRDRRYQLTICFVHSISFFFNTLFTNSAWSWAMAGEIELYVRKELQLEI